MTIYLLGLRGAGKSTLGPLLAARLGGSFVDLDQIVAEVLGHATAGDAFAAVGEPAFRGAELAALADPRVSAAKVVALGGGTPTIASAAEVLRARIASGDRLVYLRAKAETLQDRIRVAGSPKRPSLTGKDPVAEMPEVLARRDPLYRQLATATIEVDGKSQDEVLRGLISAVSA